jgi:hypothetical protein
MLAGIFSVIALPLHGAAPAAEAALAPTTTRITNQLALVVPTVVGQQFPVRWSVTVNPPNSGTPTGTVTVTGGSGCSAPVAAGVCMVSGTAPGTIQLKATYGGDGTFAGSASGNVAHYVGMAATKTLITNKDDLEEDTLVGESYTVEWDVQVLAPGGGTPTGTVIVSGDGSCSAAVATGHCELESRGAGTKYLVAAYVGSPKYYGSISGAATHHVFRAATSTEISNAEELESTATKPGEKFSVEWDVTVDPPNEGTPTGFVVVTVNGYFGCTAPRANGKCDLTLWLPGNMRLRATYSGNGEYQPSTSEVVEHTVQFKEPTTTRITNGEELSASTEAGEPFRVAWEVSPLPPEGNVTAEIIGGASCTAPVAAGECDITPATAGLKAVKAYFHGTADYGLSLSPILLHLVTN